MSAAAAIRAIDRMIAGGRAFGHRQAERYGFLEFDSPAFAC
jgi:hypothetical protein